jgi:hypothetical protein
VTKTATREAPAVAPALNTSTRDANAHLATAANASTHDAAATRAKASGHDASATAHKASSHDSSATAHKASAYDAAESASHAPTHDVPAAPPKAGTIEVSEAALGPAPHETPTPEALTAQPGTTSSQPPVMTGSATQRTKPPSTRRTIVVTVAAAIAIGLLWTGARMMRTQQSPLDPPTAGVIEDAGVTTAAPPQTQIESTLAVPDEPAVSATPVASNVSNTSVGNTPAEPEPELSAGVVTQVMPDVPQRAQQTIRGHVKTSVRLIVDPDGTVFAGLVDEAGPSKYFARLALEAAKKWTFAPSDLADQRLVQVRFDFSREGTTARAVALK